MWCSVYAPFCLSNVKKKISESWHTSGLKMSCNKVVNQYYIIPYWWWIPEDLCASLAQSQELSLTKFNKINFIMLKYKMTNFFIKEPWQMWMFILYWTMDLLTIFSDKVTYMEKPKGSLVFRSISYHPLPFSPLFWSPLLQCLINKL